MKSINDYLFTGFTELQPGVYISHKDFFWTFLSAGEAKEEGICDWWYDVAAVYPTDTIVIHPVDMTEEMIKITPQTLYRGSRDLDEEVETLCYYKVIDTTRL